MRNTPWTEKFPNVQCMNNFIMSECTQVRNTPWTEKFLRHVWNHNDGGAGESDQRSFKARRNSSLV